MKKRNVFWFILLFIVIINFIYAFNYYKKNSYYIGKIESMEKIDGVTTVEVSPIPSNVSFASELKANHKIEYPDNITISGLKDRNKKRKEVYLGQLGEAIDNLKVGDSIIFKVRNYDKNNYKLEIDKLAVDLTLE